jgi:LysM repeat protein
MDHRTPSPTRLLAPAALVAFGVIFLIVLFSTSGGEGGSAPDQGVNESGQIEEAPEEKPADAGSTKKSYTVESGDTLDSIAEKTEVDVDELQTLNPDLDPQALVAGQKIKLRE